MLLYGPDGALWPAGSVIRMISTDADVAWETGTLPAWLAQGSDPSDTGMTLTASATPLGGVRLTSAAGGGATASLVGPAITLAELRRVRLDVVLTGAATTARIPIIGFIGPDSGGWVTQATAGVDGGASFVARAAGPTEVTDPTSYNLGYFLPDIASAQVQLTLSVIIDPPDGMIAVGEHDQVWTHKVYGAALGTGVVRPIVRVQTGGSGPAAFDVNQVRLTREWL